MPDFRRIPSIEQLLLRPAVRGLEAQFGVVAIVYALRAAAAEVGAALAQGDAGVNTAAGVSSRLEEGAAVRLAGTFRPSLQPVINATGVVIHTNLGRAPLAPAALDRVVEVARGYSSLEYDLERG